MLGMKGKIGTIECGAFGDLLVLNSNPLEDITILDRPEEHLLVVMKQGKVITSLISGLN
jgi:imidazolonepropionase-like amidohydrolase